jgi:FkbM family methyltransferase
MNYGGGGLIETSGEAWVLANVVSAACKGTTSPVVFDVGANVGDYALLTKQFLPAAQVYAFEPARNTYDQLTSHLRGKADVKTYNIGFSDSERTVQLFSYEIEGNEVSLLSSIDQRQATQVVEVAASATEEILVKTIDGFCVENGIKRIDFLKIDVEGHELAVLRGARDMLGKGLIPIIQFEFGPANIYSRTFFFDFWTLLSGDYDIFRIIPAGIAPISYYGEHLEIFLTTNYLALKKLKP